MLEVDGCNCDNMSLLPCDVFLFPKIQFKQKQIEDSVVVKLTRITKTRERMFVNKW